MNRKLVLKYCLVNFIALFLQRMGHCSEFGFSRQNDNAPRGVHYQDHNRLLRENSHPVHRTNGFGMPFNENALNSIPRREHLFNQDRLHESDDRRGHKMRYWSIPVVQQRPINHDGIQYGKHHVIVSHKLPEKEFYSIAADHREKEIRRLQAQTNEHNNFVFGSIPSMPIHSSFQRIHPAQNQVLSKSPEVPLSSKKRNLVSTRLNSKNWWYPDSRTSSFQKTSHVPNEDVFFLIEFDDSDGDVTFETIMEIEELEDDGEFGQSQDEF